MGRLAVHNSGELEVEVTAIGPVLLRPTIFRPGVCTSPAFHEAITGRGGSGLEPEASCPFGDGVLIIAEVAQTHDGSLGQAHAFIDAAADSGADAIKFQTHIAAAESTRDEPWRVPFSRQDASRYDYWQRMEFTADQWAGLAEHARERDVLFVSSPFSAEAVRLLDDVGVDIFKVASGEVGHVALLEDIIATGRPVIFSSGLSDFAELDTAVKMASKAGVPHAVLQCTTAYPCPPERVGLNQIQVLADRFDCPVGLSDHSGTIFPGLASVALGAAIIEIHVTFSRAMFGPDVPASITFEQMKKLVEGIRFLEVALANPVDRVNVPGREELRGLFTRSVALRHDLPAGTVLSREDLTLKKPGSGIPPDDLDGLVGRRLRRATAADRLLTSSDLED